MKILILIEADDILDERRLDRISDHIALALYGEQERIDIEGLDGVTREGIISDVMHVATPPKEAK